MIAHLLGITAATACIVLGMFQPFLPGRYDSLATPVSMMSQVIGILGLLLVPVGALWVASEYRSQPERRRYAFALTALIASSVVWVLSSLLMMLESLTLGLVAVALWAYAVTRLVPRLRALRSATPRPRSAIPIYLTVVPIAVAILRFTLAGPVTEWSRSRAIRNSAPLIADIEAHRVARGRYPQSTLSMWPDYKPAVIAIKEYRYEPSGDAYNLLFELPSLRFGTREMVMYNPRDQQAVASHAMDVLQMTPEQLALDRTRGHYATHDAPHPHWKYFWFD